jgi:hypothetical protein
MLIFFVLNFLFQALKMTKLYFIAITLLLAVSVKAESSTGTGSFTVTKDSNINTNGEAPAATTVPKTIFKPSVTRTELKVSRSLNPDNVQTLNVRTNSGGLATIIVKKRDGKSSVNNEPRQAYYDVSNQFSRGEVRRGLFGPVQVVERLDDSTIQKLHQQQQFENGRIYNNWQQPITTMHQSQLYHRSPYENYRFAPPSPSDQKSVNLINSFMKHVQQIEDSPNRQVRSNDGSMPNDRAQVHTSIPEPVTINSESVYVKDQNAKRSRSLLEIGTDGIPLINGIRVPDDENDKRQTWRNARVINGELVPYENGYIPPRTVEYGQLIYPVKKSGDEVQGRKKSIGPFSKSDNFSGESEEDSNKSIGPFSVTDMFTSRSNQQVSEESDGNIGPFSVADNSRTTNSKLIDYIKRINDQEYRKDYFQGRSPKEAGGQQKIQRRMLTQPANAYFPPSSRYSVTKPNDSNLVGPVLQYAHPEFGLQSVGSSYEEQQQQQIPKNNKQIEHYSNNYQQQRPANQPTYQIEPAALNTREYYNYQKAPATYPYNYGFIRRVKPERPFWMKISEQMRDSFQNGFTQVQEITRPVFDPIMEAGEKISQNLGFSYQQPNQVAQDKVSHVGPVQGTSYIFPALGMLAGGAALGLGAVAMGRIFDVSSLLTMRSAEESGVNLEHKRALNAIHKAPSTTLFLVENNGNHVESNGSKRNYKKDTIEIFAAPTASPKAKFLELYAIPYHQHSSAISSIEPSSVADQSQMASHQRRKRNK